MTRIYGTVNSLISLDQRWRHVGSAIIKSREAVIAIETTVLPLMPISKALAA
jgi:hypothetical protein